MSKFLFPGKDHSPMTLSRMSRAGEARRIRQGVYTDVTNDDDIAELIHNRWHELVDHLCTRPIAAFRTAVELRPHDNRVYVMADVASRRYLEIGKWLVIDVMPGQSQAGAEPFMPHLLRSAPARQYLENLSKARERDGVIKTLGQDWVEKALTKNLQDRGEAYLNTLRDEARDLAGTLGREDEFKQLDKIIGALLNSHPVEGALTSDLAIAAAKREPFDGYRTDRFQSLIDYLAQCPFTPAPFEFNTASWRNLSFFESYFSNYIEGTEFEIDEAEQIVFENKIIDNRTEDSHDIMSVYAMVSDHQEMLDVPDSPSSFIEMLQSRHARMMAQRPDKNPGQFKRRRNQAGNSVFVDPGNLVGTLTRGFEMSEEVAPGLAQAIYMQFLISECHPFDDGNGRLSRVFLNAELVNKDQCKVIVPTVARENYLNGLRMATREGAFRTLVKVFYQLQQYTASLPWIDYGEAREALEQDAAHQHPNDGTPTFNRRIRDYRIQLPR